MLSVYGVVPLELIVTGSTFAVLPPLSGRAVGASVPVDCNVGIVGLSDSAIESSMAWCWKPVHQGYVISVGDKPASALKNHLRRIRHMQDESGLTRIWPWFDPRYLKLALNTLEGQALSNLFGPIQTFSFALSNGVETYQLQSGCLHVRQVSR